MKEKNVTQKEMADALGITQAAVSAAINGDCRISTLQKIADALNVNIQDLFDLPDIEAEQKKWYDFNFRMEYLAHKDEYEKAYKNNPESQTSKTLNIQQTIIICPHCGKEIPLKIDTEALNGKG